MKTKFHPVDWEKRGRSALAICAGLLLLFTQAAFGQTPVTFNYYYDDTGQLVKVIDSTGVVIEYVYDAVGNMLEIKRSTIIPGALTIFGFTPQRAGPLVEITIRGQGFGSTPAANVVRFNGVVATVVSASPTTLVVQVPPGALSGAISVTVGVSTAAADSSFTSLPIPAISSVSPTPVATGSSIANFQVSGVNLTGSTFSFLPAQVPPSITLGSVTINPTGTSAVFSLSIGAGVTGDFVLVATNAAGSSNWAPTTANTIRVGRMQYALAPKFSALNGLNPGAGTPATSRFVSSLVFSALNALNPGSGVQPTNRFVSSLTFSVLNALSPAPTAPTQRFVNTLMFSVANLTAAQSSAHLLSVLRNGAVAARTAQPRKYSDGERTPRDTDGDGVSDEDEFLIGTNPFDPDTDHDGYPDGLEVVLGSDPRDFNSIPDLKPPGIVVSPGFVIQNFALQARKMVPGRPTETRRSQ
jgi:YD repeat-containing protein